MEELNHGGDIFQNVKTTDYCGYYKMDCSVAFSIIAIPFLKQIETHDYLDKRQNCYDRQIYYII